MYDPFAIYLCTEESICAQNYPFSKILSQLLNLLIKIFLNQNFLNSKNSLGRNNLCYKHN